MVVRLTATPASGYTFTSWTGNADCTDGSVTMTAARSCTANFSVVQYALTVAISPAGGGSVSSTPAGISCPTTCTANFNSGTVVALTATPASGYTFTSWTGNADCTDGSVTMTAARSCTANFSVVQYALTVAISPAGGGSVSSTPAGISGPTRCPATFTSGTVVALTATPASGYTFTSWTGNADCTDGSVTMTAARSCTANFSVVQYALTVAISPAGGGSVSSTPAGISCPTTCTANFNSGTVVALTATPASGYTFTSWTGNADCTDGSVTMTAARSCTANFSVVQYALTVAISPAGGGSVSSTPAGISGPTRCPATFTSGTVVALTATPASGYTFTSWTGNADCTDGSVTMTAARSCTANFSVVQYALTVAISPAGGGSVSSTPAGISCPTTCTANFNSGTVVALTATPASGYTFGSWTGDADCTDGSVTMTAARSCTANFSVVQYALTVAISPAGGGSVSSTPAGISCPTTCTANFNSGTVVALT